MGDPVGESRSNMRIFLAVLLALLLADTITGSPTRRTRREKGQKTRKRKSSSSGSRTLLKNLNKQLSELKVAEETRDKNIEEKMDKAIDDLKASVKNMHDRLNQFIKDDGEISSNMKAQIDDMSIQVSDLEKAVTNAIDSINDGIQDQHDDDIMRTTHQLDHHDGGHDGHDVESMVEAVPEDSIDTGDEGSTSGNGENEDEEAPAHDPVAVEEPANYVDQDDEYGGSGYGGSGEGDYIQAFV